MLPTFSQNLTLQEAFETVAQLTKSKKERNSMVRFAKKSNFKSIDFLHFFAKRRKSVEKIMHQKKNSVRVYLTLSPKSFVCGRNFNA